jgi:nicotinamidase-related amidase
LPPTDVGVDVGQNPSRQSGGRADDVLAVAVSNPSPDSISGRYLRGISSLILAGISTSAVLSTVRDAADGDYQVFVPTLPCMRSSLRRSSPGKRMSSPPPG